MTFGQRPTDQLLIYMKASQNVGWQMTIGNTDVGCEGMDASPSEPCRKDEQATVQTVPLGRSKD